MIIAVCSYPRSGRHKFAAKLAALNRWELNGKPVQLVGVGMFRDIGPVIGYDHIDDAGITYEDVEKFQRIPDNDRIYLYATHKPPSEVPGRKIVLIRDPREVAVSYSHWWMRTTIRTEEQRQEFIKDWVCHSAAKVQKKWGANISKCNWTSWYSGLQLEDVLHFENIRAYDIWQQFKRFGLDAQRDGPEINFEWLRAGDPFMFRRGKRCLDEFPEELQKEAEDRWAPLIRRFWP